MFDNPRKIVDYHWKFMKQRDDNKNIKQTNIAVDFQAKFNRPIPPEKPKVQWKKSDYFSALWKIN